MNFQAENFGFILWVNSANGKIGFVGIPEEKNPIFKIDKPLEDFIFKNVEVHAILGRRFPFDWKASEELVASGKVKPGKNEHKLMLESVFFSMSARGHMFI